MAITLTDVAVERVSSFLKNRKKGVGIRLSVKTTGCSGLGYGIEYADNTNFDDEVFATKDIKIVVDAKSLIYLDGSEVDFVKDGLNEGFVFKNPNAKAECGCGESFTV